MVEDLADEVGIGDICDFKTHLEYTHVNKGARYIHVVREPKDVLVAFYGFLSGTVFDPEAIPLDLFAGFWLLATRQATFEFMFEHRGQFADTIPGTPMRFDKVVNGKVGSHANRVSVELAERIDAAWDRYVTPALVITSTASDEACCKPGQRAGRSLPRGTCAGGRSSGDLAEK